MSIVLKLRTNIPELSIVSAGNELERVGGSHWIVSQQMEGGMP